MKVKEIQRCLEDFAPASLQESYDNSGLLVGHPDDEVHGVMISLDITEEVIEDALAKDCNMIVAHHPIIFSGLKRLNGKNYVERTVMKAIKHGVALYAIHTNLDNVKGGVNHKIAETLGLQKLRILAPKKELLLKLVCFCPLQQVDEVRQAVFKAGAGHIGDYDSCSFSAKGEGTFRAGEGADPYVGNIGEMHREEELRLEFVLPNYAKGQVISAMIQAHPYEEVAYDVYALENTWHEVGSGMLGELEEEADAESYLRKVKEQMKAGVVRYTPLHKKKVKKIAVCGGSGSFLLNHAISAGADVFITSDFKYHQFFDAENKIIIADIGHYESEQFTKQLLLDVLREKFPTFALVLTEVNTNPINYL